MQNQINLPLPSNQNLSQEPQQLLPYDGDVKYFGTCYTTDQANSYLDYFLSQIAWKHDEATIYGKHYVTARQVAWYGDENYAYRYSGKTRVALCWTKQLLEIKEYIEGLTGASYNSCLLNLYEDGTQGMGWHQDDEKDLGLNTNIASLSFGAVRRFDLRHKTKRHKTNREKVSILLEHGSLLVMAGTTQTHWQHQVPKSMKITEPRVNLTFRRMLGSSLNK